MHQHSGSACFALQRDARAVFHETLRRCSTSGAIDAQPQHIAKTAEGVATDHGYFAVVDSTLGDLEAGQAAQHLLDQFRTLRQQHRRVCLVSAVARAVERTRQDDAVSHGGRCGGPNQQFVLECAIRLNQQDAACAVLSCSTSGHDGNHAAGAVIASQDMQNEEAQARAHDALARSDFHTLLRRMGCSIETGPTGLSHGDLRLFLS